MLFYFIKLVGAEQSFCTKGMVNSVTLVKMQYAPLLDKVLTVDFSWDRGNTNMFECTIMFCSIYTLNHLREILSTLRGSRILQTVQSTVALSTQ